MPPFFTIITSTYNAAATLPRLLDSLASQTCRDFNWIVQDGASSDATMQIVEQYRDRLPEILADSGKDSGIYDAWNKAIDRWQGKMGEWVLFLGADDKLLASSTLEDVKNKIESSKKNILFAAGDLIVVDEHDKIICDNIIDDNKIRFQQNKFKMSIGHPSLFTRKNVLLQYKFDTSFRIVGDHDFLIRAWQQHDQLFPIRITVTQMALGGISNNERHHGILIREEFLISIKTKSFRGVIWTFDSMIYKYKTSAKKYITKTKIGSAFWRALQKLHSKILPK